MVDSAARPAQPGRIGFLRRVGLSGLIALTATATAGAQDFPAVAIPATVTTSASPGVRGPSATGKATGTNRASSKVDTPSPDRSAPPADLPDDTADVVLGQPDFDHPFPGRTDARGLIYPSDVAVDASVDPCRLYVTDAGNHRVLGYRRPPGSDRPVAADLVIGQRDMHGGFWSEHRVERSTFLTPAALAVDPQGNLYVADIGYHRVLVFERPFETDAVADRVFGQNDQFDRGGPNRGGLSARTLAFPTGLALDPRTGDLWIADSGNHRVLFFHQPLISDTTADAVLGQRDFSTMLENAGGRGPGSLSGPTDVAVIGRSVCVCDRGNHRMLIYHDPLNTDRLADAVAGQDGRFTTAEAGCSPYRLRSPAAVAVDALHNPPRLIISDTGNHRLLAFYLPTDALLAGPSSKDEPDIPPPPAATALAADAGATTAASPALGRPTALWGQDRNLHSGQPNAGGVGPASLYQPMGLAVAPDGTLWVADRMNHRVLGYLPMPPEDRLADLVIGQADLTRATGNYLDGLSLTNPRDVALDRTVRPPRLYVCDWYNNRVLGYASAERLGPDIQPDIVIGQPDLFSNDAGAGRGGLNAPTALAVDAFGNLFVADRDNNRVLCFDAPFSTDTLADAVIGQPDFSGVAPAAGGISARSLNRPEGLCLDPAGNLYVSDTRHHRVLRFDRVRETDAVADAVWGQAGRFDQGQEHGGSGVAADTFSYPFGVKVSPQGELLVADTGNHRVLMFDLKGPDPFRAMRVWGQAGDFASKAENRGGCSAASLSGPESLALWGGGVYIADTANCRVLFHADRRGGDDYADAVFGQYGSFETCLRPDRETSVRSLWFPSGIEVDEEGSLYVADREQSRVLVFRRHATAR